MGPDLAAEADSGDVKGYLSGGKELELVREVQHYRFDLMGLGFMHSIGSGSKLLDRGWTFFSSRVAKGVRCWAGEGYSQVPS